MIYYHSDISEIYLINISISIIKQVKPTTEQTFNCSFNPTKAYESEWQNQVSWKLALLKIWILKISSSKIKLRLFVH